MNVGMWECGKIYIRLKHSALNNKYEIMNIKLMLFLSYCLFFWACKNSQVDKMNNKGVGEKTKETVSIKSGERTLVWSDEFEVNGLPDNTKWGYNVGDACDLPMGCGWGNNELQFYTDKKEKNARVKDGFLIIEAHKEKIGTRNYSSARLLSKNKGDFKYGKMEVRAKIPSGLGTWSAIWMMPTDDKYGGWPRSGEIDIMEHVGFEKDTIFGTPHTMAFNGMYGTQKTGAIYKPDAEDNFHTYAVDWTENKIDWYVDDVLYHTFNKEGDTYKKWPFDHPFHFILNIAVGGNWGGKHGVDESIWPKKMEVDYVRVYQ